MRIALLLLLVTTAIGLAAWRLWPSAKVPSLSADTTAPSGTQDRRAPTGRLAKASALPPTVPSDSPLPDSLAAVKMTPQVQAGLAKLSPQFINSFDFKLGFLKRMRECVKDRVNGTGLLETWFHMDVNADHTEAVGRDFEIENSPLSVEDTQIVAQCGREAVVGYKMKVDPMKVRGPDYHGASTLTFPLVDDRAYALALTGQVPPAE